HLAHLVERLQPPCLFTFTKIPAVPHIVGRQHRILTELARQDALRQWAAYHARQPFLLAYGQRFSVALKHIETLLDGRAVFTARKGRGALRVIGAPAIPPD